MRFGYIAIILLSFVTSCSAMSAKQEYPKTNEQQMEDRIGKLTGEEGLVLFGGKSRGSSSDAITVNSYLWRAALDSVHSMPIISADPFGGTILTDWSKLDNNSSQRFKLNVYIIGGELRSDAIKVAAFKQKKVKDHWEDLGNNAALATQVEDAILLKARQMKYKSLD